MTKFIWVLLAVLLLLIIFLGPKMFDSSDTPESNPALEEASKQMVGCVDYQVHWDPTQSERNIVLDKCSNYWEIVRTLQCGGNDTKAAEDACEAGVYLAIAERVEAQKAKNEKR